MIINQTLEDDNQLSFIPIYNINIQVNVNNVGAL